MKKFPKGIISMLLLAVMLFTMMAPAFAVANITLSPYEIDTRKAYRIRSYTNGSYVTFGETYYNASLSSYSETTDQIFSFSKNSISGEYAIRSVQNLTYMHRLIDLPGYSNYPVSSLPTIGTEWYVYDKGNGIVQIVTEDGEHSLSSNLYGLNSLYVNYYDEDDSRQWWYLEECGYILDLSTTEIYIPYNFEQVDVNIYPLFEVDGYSVPITDVLVMNSTGVTVLNHGDVVIGVYPLNYSGFNVTIKVREVFNYVSTQYSQELATTCALYSMLAYDEMDAVWYSNLPTVTDLGSYAREDDDYAPAALLDVLEAQSFIGDSHLDNGDNDIDFYNYGDSNRDNVSYVIAHKEFFYQGEVRTLVAVIIRGTDSVEWYGNMKVTGLTYNPNQVSHFSFNNAANDVLLNDSSSLDNYIRHNNISNPIYLITGHSRGAAAANLAANRLTAENGEQNVFAYTFATPNNIKSTSVMSRNNIFNFCFTDDFVPQVPLTEWDYGKHGVNYTASAEALYLSNNSNNSFKTLMDDYVLRSRERSNAVFNSNATQQLLVFVSMIWENVEDYYEKDIEGEETLYEFFRNTVAPAAMGNELYKAEMYLTSINSNSIYQQIAAFFVNGSGADGYDDYTYNNHAAFTYYTAVRLGLFTLDTTL